MNRFVPSSIRARVFVLVFLALIAPFVLVFYYAVRETRVTSQLTRDSALRLARLGAENQREIFQNAHDLLVLLARLPSTLLDPVACQSMLSGLPEKFPQFKNFAVSNLLGQVTCSSAVVRPGVNFSERPWFRQALQTGKFVSSDFLIGKIGGEPILVFAMPILDDQGTVTAVVSLSVTLDWLNRLSVQAGLPAGSVFTVIDRQGTVLGHQPESQKWLGKSYAGAAIIKTVLAQKEQGTIEAAGIDGVRRLYAFAPLRHQDGSAAAYLLIGIPEDLAHAEARAIFRQNSVWLLLVTLVVLATVWIAGRKLILERIGAIATAGRRLAGGDFSARTGLDHRDDEIGELAANFDDMAEALEARQAEQRRADELRARLAAIVESSSDAIIGRNLDGLVTSWNQGAEALFGYSSAEMIGRPVSHLIPAEELENDAQRFDAIRRGQNLLTFESVRLRKDQKRVDVSVTLSPVKGDRGRIIGVSSIVRDISERKQAEREIAALHDISMAMSSTLDLHESLNILLRKIDAVLPYAASHIRLLNKTTGELESAACRNIDEGHWKSQAYESDRSIQARIVSSRNAVIIPEIQRDGGDQGHEFYRARGFVSYLGVPILVKDQLIGVLSLLTKERHEFTSEEIQFIQTLAKQAGMAIHNSQLYEEIKRQALALEQSNAQQADFVAMIVHDLRSPLSNIMAIAEMMRDGVFGAVNAEQKKWAASILNNATNSVELINDFLDVSKLEAGHVAISPMPTALDDVVITAVEAYIPAARSKAIDLSYRIDDHLPPLHADARRLDQVLHNLLSNALKFTESGGRIGVVARRDSDDGIRVEVRDTGVGIAKDEIPGLFKKYRQASSATVSEHKGTGLGLVICKMIVEAHGGTIWAESEIGRGSAFIFRLPCSIPPQDAQIREQPSAEPAC